MAQATLTVAGRRYDIACRAGEEAHLEALGRVIDAKARQAAGAVGGINDARQLLLAALILADELGEAQRGVAAPQPPAEDPALGRALEAIAARVEALAEALEKAAAPT